MLQLNEPNDNDNDEDDNDDDGKSATATKMRERETLHTKGSDSASSATMRQCRNNQFLNAQLLPLSHFIIQYYAHT